MNLKRKSQKQEIRRGYGKKSNLLAKMGKLSFSGRQQGGHSKGAQVSLLPLVWFPHRLTSHVTCAHWPYVCNCVWFLTWLFRRASEWFEWKRASLNTPILGGVAAAAGTLAVDTLCTPEPRNWKRKYSEVQPGTIGLAFEILVPTDISSFSETAE